MGLYNSDAENISKDMEELQAENRKLWDQLNRVKVLDRVYVQCTTTTMAASPYANAVTLPPSSEFPEFQLDGNRVEVKWTKRGLKVGCTIVTREALKALSELE